MKKIISGLLLSLLLLPSSAWAASYEGNENVYVDKPVLDDLYVAGNEVNIESNIDGDLFMGGEEVLLDGVVSEDVFAGGKEVSLKGEIKGDARIAGESIEIESIIQDDVLFAGQDLTIKENSTIGGSLLFAGSEIKIEGTIKGNARGAGQNIYLNSQIDGNLTIYNSSKITFGPKAKIGGNLTYSALVEAEIPEGVVSGKTTFNEKNSRGANEGFAGIMVGFSIYSLLSTLFFGLMLIGFIPHFILHNTRHTMQSPFKSMGIGFLFVLGIPVATFILMITVIGIPLGLIFSVMGAIAFYLSSVMAALLIGRYIVKVDENSSFLITYSSFFLGALIYIMIGFIPFVGPSIKFLLILMTLGGFFLAQMDRFQELRTKKLI